MIDGIVAVVDNRIILDSDLRRKMDELGAPLDSREAERQVLELMVEDIVIEKIYKSFGMPPVNEADAKRAAFLEAHVGALEEAEREGLPVHGYLHWSLVDNYEWLDGFEPRFGLLALDRETLARRERPSAETFRRLAAEYLGRPAAPRRG